MTPPVFRPRCRAAGLAFVAALAMSAAAAATARGAEPASASVDERLRQLEERDASTSRRVRELETEVGALRGKLQQYETTQPAPAPAAAPKPTPRAVEPSAPASDLTLTPPASDKYGEGFDLTFWTWLQYQRSGQDGPDSWWAAEFELDLTKRFGDRIAASLDMQFIEEEDDAHAEIEQAFVSFLLLPKNGTILTAGKFNAPWGVEGRDYWDRTTGTVSLLFRAQPQDLTGLMLTHPLGDSGIILRPFVALGFDDMGKLNDSLAGGMMVEYRPADTFSIAATGWWGPGVSEPGPYEGFGAPGSIWTLTDAWYGPEFGSDGGHMQFIDLQATWRARRDLTLAAEYLVARSVNPGEDVSWNGALVLVNYDFDDRWRVFTHYSYLHDADAAVTEVAQRRHAVGIGLGFRPQRDVDFSIEYRYDASDNAQDLNTVTMNAAFGF
ncbi:MAG: hypothetical protein QOE14_1395 [Humisphaera sp.]|nr:hypothetical protein [Humisphaera sp.]